MASTVIQSLSSRLAGFSGANEGEFPICFSPVTDVFPGGCRKVPPGL